MAETNGSPAAGEASAVPIPGSSEVRMVLLGLTGSGRSSAGNTILGRSAFWTDVSPVSVTSRCQRAGGVVEGRSLRVIDTPGFFHSCLRPEEVRAELSRCVELSEPGPHVFLMLLRAGRVTRESRAALHWIRAAFGPDALRFTILLITWGDALGPKPVEDYLKESTELWEFACECAGGFHVFDNTKGLEERAQVLQLLEKLDLLMERNEGGHYTSDMLRQADSAVTHMQKSLLGEQEPEDEEARGAAERLFWYELLTAVGRGAAEATGVMDKGKGKGKKVKAVQRAAAIATTPLSISTAAKAVGGAVREGARVLYKHKKTLLH